MVFTFTSADAETWQFSRLSQFHHDNGKELPGALGGAVHVSPFGFGNGSRHHQCFALGFCVYGCRRTTSF